MKQILKRVAAAAALAVAVGAPSSAWAQAKTYDLQSVFGLQVPSIGPSPVKWAERVALMTNNEVRIKVLGAGEVVPPLELFGAVSSGALPMGYDWVGYWSSKIPVANLIGSMPFGANPELFLGWMFNGGGLEILQKAYTPHNVKVLPCHLVVPEAGGWFNKEINSPDDIKGLKMRIAGLGAKAMEKLGASVQLVPSGEIYVSLERGRIEATEFSAPQLDLGLGLQKIAKFYYFPGWHQPASWNSIIINMDVWKKFTPRQQQAMTEACYANIAFNAADQMGAQVDALEKIEAAGVKIRRFPDSVLAALQKASHEVMQAEAAKDPLFKEAYQSLTAYIKRNGRWIELQALPKAGS
ncbi:TRAP transporter substrate-binding protein [Ramlibacter tataouinensis]|uniref:TRAP transporter substrate-binding protein n=1 Tax=Ramlibacter tataouinensis TaxID=94132 RepID=UPI0022F38CFE|nr:TRAP transporter substrate-binding protein [Ramlibacter tataouinensis]WBY03575.1 TRAP transporter substrate-binding protein [Ramlibacter tataouinensis]